MSEQLGDGTSHLSKEARLKLEQGVTTEWCVPIEFHRPVVAGSRRVRHHSPSPDSREEAIEQAREEYSWAPIKEIGEPTSHETVAPARWDDDDPRIQQVSRKEVFGDDE